MWGFSKVRVLAAVREQQLEIDCGNASSRVDGRRMKEITHPSQPLTNVAAQDPLVLVKGSR